MPEVRSALAECMKPGRYGAGAATVMLSEKPIGRLMQIAGWPGSFEAAATRIMRGLGFSSIGDFRMARAVGANIAFRIAPERILLSLPDDDTWNRVAPSLNPSDTPSLDLSHARARIAISGACVRDLMARLLPIDLHEEAFARGQFVQTGLHSVPILLHRLADQNDAAAYDLYCPYTWAVSVWEALIGSALPLGYEIG